MALEASPCFLGNLEGESVVLLWSQYPGAFGSLTSAGARVRRVLRGGLEPEQP